VTRTDAQQRAAARVILEGSYPYVTVEMRTRRTVLTDTSADGVTGVTRSEILAAVRAAFDGGGATKPALLAAAEDARARPEAMALLTRLPEGVQLRHARELWAHLPDLPVN
jgi:hypothetical protein